MALTSQSWSCSSSELFGSTERSTTVKPSFISVLRNASVFMLDSTRHILTTAHWWLDLTFALWTFRYLHCCTIVQGKGVIYQWFFAIWTTGVDAHIASAATICSHNVSPFLLYPTRVTFVTWNSLVLFLCLRFHAVERIGLQWLSLNKSQNTVVDHAMLHMSLVWQEYASYLLLLLRHGRRWHSLYQAFYMKFTVCDCFSAAHWKRSINQ